MPHLTYSTGLLLLKQKAYKAVHSDSIEAIKDNIHSPTPYFLLGVIASEHGNHSKALDLFTKAVELGPDTIGFHVYLAKELSTLGQQKAAKERLDKAAKLETQDPFLLDTTGVIYSRSGYHEQALPHFDKAVSLEKNQANFYYNLAASAQFLGDFKKAETAYEKTILLDPKFYRAWSALVSLNKQTESNNHLQTLTTLFDEAQNDADATLQLGHAIAKTLEDLGQYEDSFEWLIRGKKTKRDQLRYDRHAGKALFEAAKTTSPTISSPSISTAPTPTVTDAPIFIFGLPRTGTTLVDRILSSHPEVTSAGELNIFAELVKENTKTQSNLVMDADTFLKTESSDLTSIGRSYIANTIDRAGHSKHMIDKMPLNFFYAGLIHRALPNARLITLRRGPMDSCLSNFRQLFSTQYSYYNYTFDIEDTAWFYHEFDALIAHWRQTIPRNRFMEVHYEDIIFDQENQTRRLLDFCDLEWDEACLRFHENAAPVSTASSVQVRQPLYSGSIGRWKKYNDKLDPLMTALGSLAQ